MSAGHSRILVTGASGFVGRALCVELRAREESVITTGRNTSREVPASTRHVIVPDLSEHFDWSALLSGVEIVVHLAARVHVMRDREIDPIAAYRKINTIGTERLARAAARSGVKKFIYLSSIKVNGELTLPGKPFRSDDQPDARGPYAMSKYEAEMVLREIEDKTNLEVVIIRPPLIYGPGVKANFHSMMEFAKRGIPLPLGAIKNRRSLVAIDNLVSLIVSCLRHPGAAGETFLVSDGEDLSTTELLRRLARACGREARLIPVPAKFLRVAAGAIGLSDFASRLLDNLQVDITKTCDVLGWKPPVGVDDALKNAARPLFVMS